MTVELRPTDPAAASLPPADDVDHRWSWYRPCCAPDAHDHPGRRS